MDLSILKQLAKKTAQAALRAVSKNLESDIYPFGILRYKRNVFVKKKEEK